jgi:hypothetical protein
MRIALAILSALLVLTAQVVPGHACGRRTTAAVDVPYGIEADELREQLKALGTPPSAALQTRLVLTTGKLLRVASAAPCHSPSYHPRRLGPRPRALDPDCVH